MRTDQKCVFKNSTANSFVTFANTHIFYLFFIFYFIAFIWKVLDLGGDPGESQNNIRLEKDFVSTRFCRK